MEQMTLEVRHLFVRFRTETGVITPVNDVSLRVPRAVSWASWANPPAARA